MPNPIVAFGVFDNVAQHLGPEVCKLKRVNSGFKNAVVASKRYSEIRITIETLAQNVLDYKAEWKKKDLEWRQFGRYEDEYGKRFKAMQNWEDVGKFKKWMLILFLDGSMKKRWREIDELITKRDESYRKVLEDRYAAARRYYPVLDEYLQFRNIKSPKQMSAEEQEKFLLV